MPTDREAQLGHFVKVVEGPHKGRYGVYTTVGDVVDGKPATAVVYTRDADAEGLVVQYSHLRPDVAGKR